MHAGTPGRIAVAIIGLQAFGGFAFALIFLFAAPGGSSLSDVSHVMFSVITGLFSLGLALVARGLWRGQTWPRTAAVVWLVLLLPVGWALLQAGRGLVGTLILGSVVVGILAVAAESKNVAAS